MDAEEAGHALATDVAPGIALHGDQELLTQAVANLVENAVCHTLPGTRITFRLSHLSGAGVCLAVQDDGPGVGPDDLPRLWHRFYRGEHSRSTPGNGRGLSFVAAVADLHGAKLRIRNAEPGPWVSLLFPEEDAP